MTHSFHIANSILLRPARRGQGLLAPAYRLHCGDRKVLLPAIC